MIVRLSMGRQSEIQDQIADAMRHLTQCKYEECIRSLDTAMKLFNGWEGSGKGVMRYDQLHEACEAFLEETQLPTLAVAIAYIENWKRMAPLARLGRAVLNSTCDQVHTWCCNAWNTEDGKRRNIINPSPGDEGCTCGLLEITQALEEIPDEDWAATNPNEASDE